jgi:uncharacterized membrane protein YdjX (TVP38/TMEM64 family)
MRKLLILAVVAALAWLAWHELPLDRLPELADWLTGQGAWGALLIGLGYALATVLMIPGALITLLVGAIYGPWIGTLIVSPASVLGATLAFMLGRGVFRRNVEDRMAKSARFQALAVAMEAQGFKILTLVRLSPVFPFTLVNYAFGLTRVRPRDYVLGSFLGMLPGTFLYVYLGSTVGDVADLLKGAPDSGAAGQAMGWGGLAVTVFLTVWITRIARRALAEAVPKVADTDDSVAQNSNTLQA